MVTTVHQGALIVGTGARTPLGLNAPSTAAAVRAGLAAMADHPFMTDKFGEPMVVARDAELPVELGTIDRFLSLALPSAREALGPLLETRGRSPQVRVFIALPEERPGLPRSLEETLAERFGSALSEEIDVQELSCHCLGNAGGLICMEHALSAITNSRDSLCLVGGVESYLEPETLEWLDETEQLHSESTIWGFCPSEAAGFCLLASEELAHRLGLSAQVKLLSAGSAMEPNCVRTDTVCIGEGLSEAFGTTLAGLPTDGAQVDHTICDMTGEPYRGNEYGFAMLRSPGRFADESDFEAPADCWGNVGAASGPLFATLAAFAAEKGYAPGLHTFLWASSDGGQRAAALLQAAAEAG